MTNRFIKIGAAAELLGVSIDTLRKWELSGELIPDRKSQAGTRFYVLKLAVGVELLKNLCCYQSAFSIANIATSVATET